MAQKAVVKISVQGLRIPVADDTTVLCALSRRLSIAESSLKLIRILRRSVDARQRCIVYDYTVAVELQADTEKIETILAEQGIKRYCDEEPAPVPVIVKRQIRAVVIGSGPAGLFAAHTLLERGIRPVVIEQGLRIRERIRKVSGFWQDGCLDESTNVLFGEGGAGTFSDGKLTTRIKSSLKKTVYDVFVRYGAPEEISYVHKPHLGTDRLRILMPAFVDDLSQRGAHFIFGTRVDGLRICDGCITGVIAGGTAIDADVVFAAAGHCSHQTFDMLLNSGVALERKATAIGLRIEHPREYIDGMMYRDAGAAQRLGAADYFLSFKDRETGRSVYTFCMCPGGSVIGCASSDGEQWTNGMSTYARNRDTSNAAVVVTVGADDYVSDGPFGGMELQRCLERKTHSAGGGGYRAPAQTAAAFVGTDAAACSIDECSFRPGVSEYDMHELLPPALAGALVRALRHFDEKMPGFISRGVLIGTETRTSSPVRIVRNRHNFNSSTVRGLVPIGEGSGYAGGIISSAVDGLQAGLCFDT